MTTLALYDRKRTTKAGLEALNNLINSFDFEFDIETCYSDNFDCRADMENNFVYSDTGFFKIKDGEIKLVCAIEDYMDKYTMENDNGVDILKITKIDFKACFKALVDVIKSYNTVCENKDKEIENFLNFTNTYLNNK